MTNDHQGFQKVGFCLLLAFAVFYLFGGGNVNEERTGIGTVQSKSPPSLLLTPDIRDPWLRKLLGRLDRIRANCGPLCTMINSEHDMDRFTVKGGTEFRQIRVPVDCQKIMLDEEVDAGDRTAPASPPDQLMPFYTLGGSIQYIQEERYTDFYLGGKQTMSPTWTEEYVSTFSPDSTGKVSEKCPYSREDTQVLHDHLKKYTDMKGKQALVVGTQQPWVEAICLHLGAAHVTTLEYGEIFTQHPRITTYTSSKFRELYQQGKITNDSFDIVVSFSSLEHPGLGRYGDALNPWGDILAVARARCVTKKGGCLALAVPSKPTNDDVVFNHHREYGPVRTPLLTANNWVQVDKENHKDMYQSTHIFQNLGW